MREIPLTQGQVALVDDDLYLYLSQYKWSLDGSGYPQRNMKTDRGWRPVRMHRVILGLRPGEMGDHINGRKCDNRRANLRQCEPSGNVRNRPLNRNSTTGYKGVYFNKSRSTYQVYITVNYQHRYVGRYATPEEGARAYDAIARQLFGEFAFLNFPSSGSTSL